MKITVLGWYGHGNCGDESYKIAFPLLFPDNEFTFVDSIKERPDADLIIIGGGDVVKSTFMDDIYGIDDIPIFALSVTITEGSDLDHLYKFKKIIVRDKISLDIAKHHHSNVSYLPDFSFALNPDKVNGRKIIQEKFGEAGHVLSNKVVTVVPNSYISYNHDEALSRDVMAFDRLAHELARISERMDSSWVFLPFSTKAPWDDRSTCSWLGDRCKKKYYKNLVIYDKLSVQDTLDFIAGSDAVISTRLHSTIFSTISGIPFIDVLHHDKNYGFVKTLGREDWSTWLWQFDSIKTEKILKEFLTVTGQGAELQKFTRIAKEQLRNASPNILR